MKAFFVGLFVICSFALLCVIVGNGLDLVGLAHNTGIGSNFLIGVFAVAFAFMVSVLCYSLGRAVLE